MSGYSGVHLYLIPGILYTSPWQGACLGDQFTESARFNEVETFNMEVV